MPKNKSEDKKIYKEFLELKNTDHCALCGSYSNLHIHHIEYGACGRKTYIGNLIRLCQSCHNKVHTNKKLYMNKLKTLADKLYL